MTLLTRQTFLVRFRASASIRCQSDPHACILFTFCQSRSSTSLHELRMALLSHTVRAYSHRVRDASALALMLKRYLEALHWAIASRQDTVVPRLVVRTKGHCRRAERTRNGAEQRNESRIISPHITSDIRPKPGGNHSKFLREAQDFGNTRWAVRTPVHIERSKGRRL